MHEALFQWLLRLGPWAYPPIFVLIFAESGLLLLLPGETVLLLAGVLAQRGVLVLPVVMAVAVCAALLGDATGFMLGRGPARRRFHARGRLLFLRAADAAKMQRLIDQHGGLAIVIARFVGLLRTAAPFVCGLLALPPRRFFSYNVPACVLWGICIPALGALGGNAWERLHGWIGRVSLLTGLVLLSVSLLWAKRRRAAKVA